MAQAYGFVFHFLNYTFVTDEIINGYSKNIGYTVEKREVLVFKRIKAVNDFS